jgi:hypothetical protein
MFILYFLPHIVRVTAPHLLEHYYSRPASMYARLFHTHRGLFHRDDSGDAHRQPQRWQWLVRTSLLMWGRLRVRL